MSTKIKLSVLEFAMYPCTCFMWTDEHKWHDMPLIQDLKLSLFYATTFYQS